MVKTCPVVFAVVLLGMAGCGGGSSGGGGGEVKRVFVLPHVLESSGRITRVATGDVNGDGLLDLVELRESPTRHVTLQLASGLRESPTLPSTGPTSVRGAKGYNPPSMHVFVWDSASDLAVADMDGDGCPDLIVAGGTTHQVGVWRCDPVYRDEFLSPFIVDTAGPAVRVAAADVNGDGKSDLVTLDESTGQAEVFLQMTASPLTFAKSPVPMPPLGACHGLIVCDMDRDGRPDCVTNDPAGDRVLFLMGGAAGFTLRESPTKASTGKAMAVADVDGDGWLDVVVVDEGGHSVTCLHQRPAEPGVFDDVHSPLGIAVNEEGIECAGIAIGDPGVNGNFTGFPDGGSPMGSLGGVRVRESPTRASLGQAGLVLADLDRDGRLDLVCAPLATDPDANPVIVFGSPSTRGGFGASTQRGKGIVKGVGGGGASGMCVCDLDNDGHLDIAVCDPDNRSILLEYFETGDVPTQDQFQQSPPIDSALTHHEMTAADIDRDGFPDLVCATTDGVQVRFQDAAAPGTYLAPVTLLQGLDCRCVAVGDMNRDGCPDIVVGAAASGATLIRNPAVIRGFLAPILFPPPPPGIAALRSLALADLDDDGFLDVVCIRESPTLPKLGQLRGTGNGFFDVFTEIDCGPGNWIHVAAGDVNGDGKADVAVCGEAPDGCAVVLQDPLTPLKFGLPQALLLQGGVRVATGDVNGDGRCDIVTAGGGGVLVALQSADVNGRFLPAFSLSKETCGGLAIGDLDRDGRADVCFVESKTGTVACTTGDPDFDLLRVISLNGLPPGVPYVGISLVDCDDDCDGLDEVFVACPSSLGAVTGTIRRVSRSP